MNNELDLLLKELKNEKVKLASLIERAQEARITALSSHLQELAKICGGLTINASKDGPKLSGYNTKAEVARHFKVSVRTIDNLRANGAIPYMKIGGSVRFRIDEVEKALEYKY